MRSWWNTFVVGLAALALGTASCGDSDEEPEETPYEQFSARYAELFCGALEPCCTFTSFSVGQCRTWMRLFFVYEAAAAREDKFVFHQDRANQCLTELETKSLCSGTPPAVCDTVTEGLVAGGEVCRSSAECVSTDRSRGACQVVEDDGICSFPGRAAGAGERCAGDCDEELECNATAAGMDGFCYRDTGLTCTDGACEPLAAVGAPCSGFGSCVDGATCTGATCVALAGLGGACMTSSNCRPEHYCSSGVCAERVLPGSPCPTSDSCQGTCIEGRCADIVLETLCLFGSPE